MGLFQSVSITGKDGPGRGLTGRCYTIVFTFVILVAVMRSGEVMLATELLVAMLAFEREEVDEAAVLGGTLVPDCEESTRWFGGCGHGCSFGIRVRCALVCLYTPWPM